MDKITSKSSIRPVLQGIYFAPDKMVATDSFRLIEVKKEISLEGEPRVMKAKGFRGHGAVSVDANNLINDGGKLIGGEVVDADYPEYEKVFEGLSGEPRFSMDINAKYLAEVAAEVDAQSGGAFHKVRLDFFESMKALVISAEGKTNEGRDVSIRALVAPMNG
jgi:DNA polymerase III sliding clamp (beta) subunit (PCNA family)